MNVTYLEALETATHYKLPHHELNPGHYRLFRKQPHYFSEQYIEDEQQWIHSGLINSELDNKETFVYMTDEIKEHARTKA